MSREKKLTELAISLNFDVDKIYQHIADVLLADIKGADDFDKKAWRQLSIALHPDKHPNDFERAQIAFNEAKDKYQNGKKNSVDTSSLWGDFEVVEEETQAPTNVRNKPNIKVEKELTEEEQKWAKLKALLITKHQHISRENTSAEIAGKKDYEHYQEKFNNSAEKDPLFVDAAIVKESAVEKYLKLMSKRFLEPNKSRTESKEMIKVNKLYDEIYYRSEKHIPGKLEENYKLELDLKELFEQFSKNPHRLISDFKYSQKFKTCDISLLKNSIEKELKLSNEISTQGIDQDKCAKLREDIKKEIERREEIVKSENIYVKKVGNKKIGYRKSDLNTSVAQIDLSFFRNNEVSHNVLEKLFKLEQTYTSIAEYTKAIHQQTIDENFKRKMKDIENDGIAAQQFVYDSNNNKYQVEMDIGSKNNNISEAAIRKEVKKDAALNASSDFISIRHDIESSSNPIENAKKYEELQKIKLDYISATDFGPDKLKKLKQIEKIEEKNKDVVGSIVKRSLNVEEKIEEVQKLISGLRR